MRSTATLLATVLIGALLSGCAGASEANPILATMTTVRETAPSMLSLGAAPDGSSTELELLVTSSWCSGGLMPAGIDSVDVEETDESIVIEVRIDLPLGTWPTTCPPNPSLEALAWLKSPVGDRSIWTHSEQGLVQLWPVASAEE